MRKLNLVSNALLFCVAGIGLMAETLTPVREVKDNVLVSTRDPSVQIELPQTVRHVGADRWLLNDIADCELHVFVEADAQKQVKRFYWIQFEAYLPSKPEAHYNYPAAQQSEWDGWEFFVRPRFGPTNEPPKKGSDYEHVKALLRAGGYTEPAEMMNVRLVHLLDEQKRSELMIIYAEDLAPVGVSWTDLLPEGKAHAQWAGIAADLTARAKASILLRKSTSSP
jgi:hypothetical protein